MVTVMSKGQQYPRISVVIPALNEAQNLQYVLPHNSATRLRFDGLIKDLSA